MKLAEWFKENPKVFSEWDTEANTHISLDEVGHSSRVKAWWICARGHKWEAEINSRTNGERGCPYCAGKKAFAGYNDLATVNPEVLKRWNYEKNTDISPTEVTEFSKKLVWWKCEKGHSWQQEVRVVTLSTTSSEGCPYCCNLKVLKGYNDLLFLNPEVAKEWCYELNELKPDEVSVGTHKSVWWKCELGHTWQAPVYIRATGDKTKCPYCSNYKAWEGFNDLKTVNPRVASEWCDELNGDLKPTMVLRGSHKKVWWECSAGHVWEAFIYARAKENGTGCPVCAGVVKPKREF